MVDVVTVGEAMARLSSQGAGPLRHSPALDLGIAGAESNTAIGLARLGVLVQWVGRVGNDEFGQLITTTMRGEGVQVHATVDAQAQTGLFIRERRTSAVTRVTYYRHGSAGSRLQVDDLDEAAIQGARLLHITGITPALSASARRTVERSVTIAKNAGVTVSFDVNYRAKLWDRASAREALRPIAATSDIVFAGLSEARLVVEDGVPDQQLAEALQALGPRHVVLKQGRLGACSLVDGVAVKSPMFEVSEVDPVGAGDAFAAGYLAEWVAGEDPVKMLGTAARCGALVVTVEGDWEGQPSRGELGLLSADDVQR